MTDFDFNFSTDLRKYAKQRDEIGVVASAMMEMQSNYTEFIDQVKYIDQKIRNIDIEKNEPLKVKVSEKNPFNGVIDSMNMLLGKINQNFIQLKETNREINYLALHDPLTKLPNRRQYIDLLAGRLQDGKRER
jgi:predicted signal transduction protein with EAL and GGDEF domain